VLFVVIVTRFCGTAGSGQLASNNCRLLRPTQTRKPDVLARLFRSLQMLRQKLHVTTENTTHHYNTSTTLPSPGCTLPNGAQSNHAAERNANTNSNKHRHPKAKKVKALTFFSLRNRSSTFYTTVQYRGSVLTVATTYSSYSGTDW
jgi:hypothetical protein